MSIKISLFGNCQTKYLTWYLSQLPEDVDVNWIVIERFHKVGWIYKNFVDMDKSKIIVDTSFNSRKAYNCLNKSDYIIYQKIRPCTSKFFNFKKVEEYFYKKKLISIPNFFMSHLKSSLDELVNRKNYQKIDIFPHKELEEYRKDLESKRPKFHEKIDVSRIWAPGFQNPCANHPKTKYYLFLVKHICKKLNLKYFSEEKIDYINNLLPNG